MPPKEKDTLAIISDTHSMSMILKYVLEHAKQETDKIVHNGDIVGYGADPRGSIELVMANCEAATQGNHDRAHKDQYEHTTWISPRAFGLGREQYASVVYGMRHIYGDNIPISNLMDLKNDVQLTIALLQARQNGSHEEKMRQSLETLMEDEFKGQSWRLSGKDDIIKKLASDMVEKNEHYQKALAEVATYRIGQAAMNYLLGLQKRIILREFRTLIVHGSPFPEKEDWYMIPTDIKEDERFKGQFNNNNSIIAEEQIIGPAEQGISTLVVGHSHLSPFYIKGQYKSVLGNGSIMPRFSDESSYILLRKLAKGQVTIEPKTVPIPQDLLKAEGAAMKKAGLPDKFEEYKLYK